MADHIQIGDERPWIQMIQASAGNVDFPFDFPIFEDANLEVYVDGDLRTAGFAVTGAGESTGGKVTFAAAPEVGAVITVRRRLAIARTSDFQESGEFRAKVLNDELDYQTAALQQVSDDVARALRLPATDADADMTVPDKTTRGGRFLAFDENGKPTAVAGATDVPVSPYMAGVLADANADELLATMGLTPVVDTFEAGMGAAGDAADPFTLTQAPASTVEAFVWLDNVPQLANWTITAAKAFHFDFTPDAGAGVRILYRTGDA